jgi:hypothetical protein
VTNGDQQRSTTPDEFTMETTMTAWAEFTVAELRDRAGDDAFQSAGQGTEQFTE